MKYTIFGVNRRTIELNSDERIALGLALSAFIRESENNGFDSPDSDFYKGYSLAKSMLESLGNPEYE